MPRKPTKTVTVTVSNRTVVRVIILVVITVLGLRFVSQVSHVLTLVFIAFFLALALNPAVSWLNRHLHLRSRVWATATAYLTVLVILTAFIAAVIPPLIRQTSDFIASLPATVSSFNERDSSLARFARSHDLTHQLDSVSQDISQRVHDLPGPVLSTAGRVSGAVISVITVLIMTFMMLVEGPFWIKKLGELPPIENRAERREIVARMYRVVSGYVNGQLLIAIIAAAFALVVMIIASTILHTSINAVGLAGIIALTGLIPMIGNTIGAVFVVIVCLLSSVALAVVMAVFFIVYQQVENATIQPYIQAKNNELTPLLVFIAALVGIAWSGFLGAFIAIPAAGCLKILLVEWYDAYKPTKEVPANGND